MAVQHAAITKKNTAKRRHIAAAVDHAAITKKKRRKKETSSGVFALAAKQCYTTQ